MELQAAAAALAMLEGLLGPCQVDLYTDSRYLQQGITEWLSGWVRRGWLTRNKRPVRNQDLWRQLYRLTQAHQIDWHWLQGHSGHPLNERADQLATRARRSLAPRSGSPGEQEAVEGEAPSVEIYVKASSKEARGPSGWGAVLRTGDHVRGIRGGAQSATANAMLVVGTTAALRALKTPCSVIVYSDADYLIKGASQWIKGWQVRGWLTKEGKPVANQAEWLDLLDAMQGHRVSWVSVVGEEILDDLVLAGELAAEAIGAFVVETEEAKE
jgi:ribonuclease HI